MYKVTLYDVKGNQIKSRLPTPSIRNARRHKEVFELAYSDNHYVEITDIRINSALSILHWRRIISGETGHGEPMSMDLALHIKQESEKEGLEEHEYWIKQDNLVMD